MAISFFYVIVLIFTAVNSHRIERGIINGSVQLPCRTSINKPVDWEYLENGQYVFVAEEDVITNAYRGRVYISNSFEFRNLTITGLKKSDAKIYTCIEKGGLGRSHTPINLIVINYKGVKYTQNVTVGDNVEIMCPLQATHWAILCNKLLVPLHNKGHFNKVALNNTGIYFCFENEYWYPVKLVVYDNKRISLLNYSVIAIFVTLAILLVINAAFVYKMYYKCGIAK